jgi:hypothetical protein
MVNIKYHICQKVRATDAPYNNLKVHFLRSGFVCSSPNSQNGDPFIAIENSDYFFLISLTFKNRASYI